jgi:hypothetical protein
MPTSSQTSTTTTASQACPYHSRVPMNTGGQPKGLSPMDRFLAEGPTEQSALFIRSDTGELSTNKGCTCGNQNRTL